MDQMDVVRRRAVVIQLTSDIVLLVLSSYFVKVAIVEKRTKWMS